MWRTVPNFLTLLRLLIVPCFLVVSFRGMFTMACVLFVMAAVTDILDGFLARRLNQRSRLGAFLDPLADKTLMASGYLFYTFHPAVRMHFPVWLTFVIFARDILIVLFAYLVYTRMQVKRFPPSWAGKASTVLQAVALAVLIAVNSFLPGFVWAAELLFRIALVVTLYSAFDYLRRAEGLLEPAES